MDKKETKGSEETPLGVRILVLLPADNKINEINENGFDGLIKKAWDCVYDANYKDDINARVDFYTVGKVSSGAYLQIYKKNQSGELSPEGSLDPESIKTEEYDLGIAYGDWLTDWINNNGKLTPKVHSENAILPFILITTEPAIETDPKNVQNQVFGVMEPHLKAYPGEELVGMMLARLMDMAADRARLGKGCDWRAFFFKKKDEDAKELGCCEAFKKSAKDLGFDMGKGYVFPFTEASEVEKRLKSCNGDELFCVYAASAPNEDEYCKVVKAINDLNGEKKKTLVTDACWAVPKDYNNLQIAQLCVMQSQTGDGKLLVGRELSLWLIPVLLELALKTVKWCRGIKATKSERKKSITDLITEFGPLMVVQGTTFSFIEREMFIPFSYNFRGGLEKWNSPEYEPTEKIRSAEEAREAVAVAMSRIQKAADEFKKERTGTGQKSPETETKSESKESEVKPEGPKTEAKPKTLEEATAEFAEAFEEEVLKPCFAAKKVFFVDDQHRGVRQARWAFPFKMPKNCVDEVAGNSRVIQVSYNQRNIENTEAVQLYRVRKVSGGEDVAVSVADSLLMWLHGIDEKVLSTFYCEEEGKSYKFYIGDDQKKAIFVDKVGASKTEEMICSRSQQRAKRKLSDERAKSSESEEKKADRDFDNGEIFVGLARVNRVMRNPDGETYRYQYNYLYYIPAYNWDRSGNMPAVAFFSDVKFCDFELSALKMVVTRFYSALYTEDRVRKIKTYSIRSAIGAIMSRNGSHNIGSHVLASLSHHVGTCPDDRVMYQYIQHRMDYIAMAITDFPNWRQPMWLVGDLMKTFLSQRHLLDGIAKSEGLVAYQFQNVALPVEQPSTIRLHARRILLPEEKELTERKGDSTKYYLEYNPDALGVKKFVDYPDPDSPSGKRGMSEDSRYSNDIDVAIAGGEVGQHALFTIIENVLRNAAKHSWAKLLDKDKKSLGSLNVYLDFRERADEGDVECIVWSDVPVDGLEELVKGKGGLVEKASQKFVKSNGQLRRDSLGLAEMRIAAGFLTGKDIRQIGGQEGTEKCLDLICPVDVVRKTDPGKHRLGFRFKIPKPRELLVLTSEDLFDKHNDGELVQERIEVRAGDGAENHLNDDNNNVFGGQKGVEKKGVEIDKKAYRDHYPHEGNSNPGGNEYRTGSGKISLALLKNTGGSVRQLPGNQKMSCGQGNGCAVISVEQKIVPDASGEVARFQRDLRRQGVWVKSWEEFCKDKDGAFSYVILDGGIAEKLSSNPNGDEGRLALRRLPFRTIVEGDASTWKGLFGRDVASVSEKDGIVGEIKKAVQAETKGDANGVAENLLKRVYKTWIDTLTKNPLRTIKGDEVKKDAMLSVVVDVNGAESGAGRGLVDDLDIVYYALENMLDSAINSFLDVANGLSKDDRDAFDHLMSLKERPVLKEKGNTVKEVIVWHVDYWQDVNDDDLLGRLTSIDSDYNLKSTPVLTKFIKFFEEVVLAQTKAILSGYKERIATLPPSFGVGDTSGFCAKFDRTWPDVATIYFSGEDTERFKHGNSCLAFCRHLEFGACGGDRFQDMLYAEPLSGAQSYLNALIAFRNRARQYKKETDLSTNDIRLMTKMLECGLLRVLIIDERMKKFKTEHADIARTFDHIGVVIMDDTDKAVKQLFEHYQNGNMQNVLADYEIVIIHMGIIDKLLPEHEKSEDVGKFVTHLQGMSHYVVVTTGRGAPPNLPPDARVLPFSVVESAMFSRYPEKMTLVDDVMNVLPGKGVAQ